MVLSSVSQFALHKFTKSIFEFEVLNANTSRFAPCRIRLKMCAEMKEEAQAHYFRIILAILIKV